jgi:hypothetical protein
LLFPFIGIGQKLAGIEYGRAYFRYNYNDYGNGFRTQNASNYNFIVGITYEKELSTYLFWQTGIYFTQYQQYYSTKKYTPAFEKSYPTLQIPAKIGIMTKTVNNLRFQLSGGIVIGLMPDTYTAKFEENLIYPVFDSITRGEIKRNYSFIFPLIDLSGGLSYKLSENLFVYILGSCEKGFIKITQYDLYYNIGSGINDQRAKQWGKGDMYNVRIGLGYKLKNKKLP